MHACHMVRVYMCIYIVVYFLHLSNRIDSLSSSVRVGGLQGDMTGEVKNKTRAC